MAGTESSETPILKLNLLVDKEKNEVVFAQAGKDFVDVLFGFMALPMGTIVRMLEKNKQNSAPIGCFNNLYKSVVDMDKVDFTTEGCKDMLLYPRYVKEKQCRRLNHLNIDDDVDRCNLMRDEFKVPEGGSDELFVTPRTSFIISGNMKVEFASLIRAIKILVGLGHNNFDRLEEMFVDVNHEEVLSLLHCLFSSETPFTDVFLKKHSSCGMTRKQTMKVLYAESGQDFVDLLFSFLAIPLESVWEITGSNIELGCIGNFCRSLKNLSSSGSTDAPSNTCMLPWQYSLQKPLLGVSYLNNDGSSQLTPHCSSGFVKRGVTYMVSDDLTICIKKKFDVNLDDIEEHEINISKTQAIGLLRASFMTSTALTTAFESFLPKKSKEEKL
ncbi:hypothetical protein ISN45_Aa01g003080 [Arabidopsis thaliana x Arabidopsis arenosa]|uniref:DUF674 family protein n=1 Tax=Arabidopsis thaliana x Arabidopsis arenosa TaxID=1240361 RepID=A0A8T2C735_9BRAS|nr:hypothetical protein ISN45_Aa01g003080 [Arabidopsis thaliana x Arabidopsis arenosa]